MTACEETGIPEEIEILLFRVDEQLFAIDTTEVSAMIEYTEEAVSRYNPVRFDEAVGFRESVDEYFEPRIITLRGGEGKTAVVIDRPEEIMTLRVSDLRPLPPLLYTDTGRNIVWGFVLIDEEVVSLVNGVAIAEMRK